MDRPVLTQMQMGMAYANTMRCKATLLVYHGCWVKSFIFCLSGGRMEENEMKTPKDIEIKAGWFAAEMVGRCPVCLDIHTLTFDGCPQCGKG